MIDGYATDRVRAVRTLTKDDEDIVVQALKDAYAILDEYQGHYLNKHAAQSAYGFLCVTCKQYILTLDDYHVFLSKCVPPDMDILSKELQSFYREIVPLTE